MITTTRAMATATRCSRSTGKADAIWATPDDTETATVST